VFASLPIPRLQATVEEQLQEQMEEVKQKLEEAMETIEDQEFALEVGDEEIARMKECKRKHKELLHAKAEEKKVAVAKAVAKEREVWEAKVETELEHKSEVVAEEYKGIFEQQRLSVNKAHAEKRAAWERTAQANRKAKRLAVEAEKLTNVDESESEVSEDESMGEDSDGHEDSPCQPMKLGFEVRPRRDERGRWQAEDEDLHACRLAQLARGVAPSTAAANVQDIIDLVMPGAQLPSPCTRSSQIQRGEVTLGGEAMAAAKFAACKRVMTVGWDESTKFTNAVFAIYCQLEMFDGTIEEVCLRGLTILPDGGTSKAILAHIENRIFAYSRTILAYWKEDYQKENGPGSWAAAGMPEPDNIGLHRLCEDTVLMSDTCNGARCTKRLLAEAIMLAIKEKVGADVWDKLTEEERDAQYKVYRGDCWQHLRNIIIEAMATAGDKHIKEKLEADGSLAEFSSFERIEVEGSSIIRSTYKYFNEYAEYHFGRQIEFKVWRVKHHKSALFIPFERALGNRQDLKFDGCVALFWNRLICLEFVRGFKDCPKSAGILDKSIYTRLRSNEFVALLRVNVLWKYLFSDPFRWLSGKTAKLENWSLFKMCEVLKLIEVMMNEIVANPARILDASLDPFASVATEVPAFAEWRQKQLEYKVHAEDGTEYLLHQVVLREARRPVRDGHKQAHDLTLELAKEQAQAALDKMHNPAVALADKLESQGGANCFSEDAHKRTQKCYGTNDSAENKFAIGDHYLRTYRHLSIFNVSGIVQQRGAHDYDRPLRIVSDKRKRRVTEDAEAEQKPGYFWRLSRALRRSLVRMARRRLAEALKVARAEKLSYDEEKLQRREEAVQRQLDAAVEKYAAAIELYDAWRTQGIQDKPALERALKGLSPNEQLTELRRQVEMRTVGCGWRQFETKWSFFSDERHHTIEKLRSMLIDDILPHERALRRLKKLPAEAAPPQLNSHVIKTLGTADADALKLEATSLFNLDNLKIKAEAARERREAEGISDRWEAKQQKEAPPFDVRLVGKRIEVCWPYKENDTTIKIWASGTVKRVADGLTDRASSRAKKILPAGALLWAWDADPEYEEAAGEKWLMLLPKKWNKQVQYAWRYDPCELAPPGTARPPPRAPRFEPGLPHDEFMDDTQPYVPHKDQV
jgi:hypothetical protein